MRFGKDLQENSEVVPMAPLIDIVFLTLIFFMVTSVYSTLESEVDITLPTSSSAVLDARSHGEIFINLREDGVIILNNKEISLDKLQEILYSVAEYYPGGSVIIRGDESARLGRALAIIDRCKNADIQNVSFAAISTGDEP